MFDLGNAFYIALAVIMISQVAIVNSIGSNFQKVDVRIPHS